MKKDINFYRECLKRELSKPFNKQDFMYMRYLDEKIYDLREDEWEHYYENKNETVYINKDKELLTKTK